jgi:predicted GTPase
MSDTDGPRRIVIMGAAGRDFHNFQMRYRNDPSTQVVAFTATQIPGIDSRVYPADLAGELYPQGIPIVAEQELGRLIADNDIDAVVFAYSDIAHVDVMHKASLVLALGPDFELLGPDKTMLQASVPVISVTAVRTGVGKSGISRRVWQRLLERGIRAVDIRHPMPYRDLSRMRVERYASLEDLDDLGATIEEREEYEHLIDLGAVVFAGVDYADILDAAEKEAQVVIWDGGNNDMPFIKPDLDIVALDPHRPGHERLFHPGEANFLRGDVLVINKVDSADAEHVSALIETAKRFNPDATIVLTKSITHAPDGERMRGKRVLAIEDGPTVTHGGMSFGAAALAAREFGAAELVDPRPWAVGSIRSAFEAYPHLTEVLPAVGYSEAQLRDLEATIAAVPADVVAVGTPIDLGRLVRIDKPSVRVTYGVEDASSPGLDEIVDEFLDKQGLV